MSGIVSRGVFLSYRREDAGPYARSLQLQLGQRMPDVPVFMDLDSIEPGLDFAEAIEDALKSCAVLVALIGRQWLTLTDEEGARRLDNPDDYVRFEVKTALERGVRVIPVLIDDARPPRQRDLPDELQKLARLNAHKLSYDRYKDDADRLVDLIQRVLATAAEQARADDPARKEEPQDTTNRGMRFYPPRRATIKDVGATYFDATEWHQTHGNIKSIFPDLAEAIIHRGNEKYWKKINWHCKNGMVGDVLGWIFHPNGKVKIAVLRFTKDGEDVYYIIGESGIALTL